MRVPWPQASSRSSACGASSRMSAQPGTAASMPSDKSSCAVVDSAVQVSTALAPPCLSRLRAERQQNRVMLGAPCYDQTMYMVTLHTKTFRRANVGDRKDALTPGVSSGGMVALSGRSASTSDRNWGSSGGTCRPPASVVQCTCAQWQAYAYACGTG